MMTEFRVIVFAYNFPHRKTQDILHRLFVERIPVAAVLAADAIPLKIPPSTIRIKPRYGALVHPKQIAGAYNWPYHVVDHRSNRCLELISESKANLGLITGARILTPQAIE